MHRGGNGERVKPFSELADVLDGNLDEFPRPRVRHSPPAGDEDPKVWWLLSHYHAPPPFLNKAPTPHVVVFGAHHPRVRPGRLSA